MVAPVFFMMIFGIMEFGFLFRNYLTLSASTNDAVRTAGIRGSDADADFQALQTFAQTFAAWDLKDFQYLVIFEADGPDAQVPEACKTGSSAADNCNHYEVADLFRPMVDGTAPNETVNFGDCTKASDLDKFWCPLDRDADLGGSGADAGVDMVGIYVVAKHTYITGFFKDNSILSSTQIVRLEPEKASGN